MKLLNKKIKSIQFFFIDNILQNITKSIKLKLIFLYNKLWLLVDLVNILLSFWVKFTVNVSVVSISSKKSMNFKGYVCPKL